MIKVITYGTFDLLHYGHIRLLERAKALGDYLIVGITSDDYDKFRGKINIQQSLIERIQAVRKTGLADEIIVEEYDGQKIDDIKRLNCDIFTVGSDWIGKFDYLNEYCKVIYLPRTEGVSSSDLRSNNRKLLLGIVGDIYYRSKLINESKYVNGLKLAGIYSLKNEYHDFDSEELYSTDNYNELLSKVDAVYIISHPRDHFKDCKVALLAGKHVLCESPISLNKNECLELFTIAKDKNLILMDGIKTAYSTAYKRLILMAKTGSIGDIISVDSVCTSLHDIIDLTSNSIEEKWNSICSWGPTALLPIFQILGTNYKSKIITTKFLDKDNYFDAYTKIDFIFNNSLGSIKVAKAAKSEGELIITGSKGYIFVPSPWWKTDYFEIRYENFENNKRFFYQLNGEGIRYELVSFVKTIQSANLNKIDQNLSVSISNTIEHFYNKVDLIEFGAT